MAASTTARACQWQGALWLYMLTLSLSISIFLSFSLSLSISLFLSLSLSLCFSLSLSIHISVSLSLSLSLFLSICLSLSVSLSLSLCPVASDDPPRGLSGVRECWESAEDVTSFRFWSRAQICGLMRLPLRSPYHDMPNISTLATLIRQGKASHSAHSGSPE